MIDVLNRNEAEYSVNAEVLLKEGSHAYSVQKSGSRSRNGRMLHTNICVMMSSSISWFSVATIDV